MNRSLSTRLQPFRSPFFGWSRAGWGLLMVLAVFLTAFLAVRDSIRQHASHQNLYKVFPSPDAQTYYGNYFRNPAALDPSRE